MSRQNGFTLVEVLVVILILGVVIVIAAPSFLGQTDKAQDSSSQQYLAIAFKSARALAVSHEPQGSWGDSESLAAELNASEPALDVKSLAVPPAASTDDDGRKNISLSVSGSSLTLYTKSDSGLVCGLTAPENGAHTLLACQTPEEAGFVTPVNQTPPIISDADNALSHVQVGDHLSASTGSWDNSPAGYSYQWQRSADGSNWITVPNGNITGANSSSYIVQSGDLGYYLRAVVTAANAGGAASMAAAATAQVLPAVPVNTLAGQPTISGDAQVGATLTADPGAWSSQTSVSYAYQWQQSTNGSSWVNASGSGATTSSYVVDTTDLDDYLRVVVTAENAGGSGSASSEATAKVLPAAPVNSAQPIISDADNAMSHIQAGDHLSTTTGTWSSQTSLAYAYQWQTSSDGSSWANATGSGATTSAYIVDSADLSGYLRVVVTAENSGGTGAASSEATTAIFPATPVNTTQPVVTDADNAMTHIQVGDQMSTTTGAWSSNPTGYSYQWQTSSDGSTWANAAGTGATTSSYTVSSSDLGNYLRVIVQATNSGGSASASSAATVAVLPATPTNTSQPVISDADNAMSHIQVGDNLSTTTGVWSNSPTGYSYQWQTSANGSTWTNAAGAGATTSAYTVSSSDLGNYLRAVVQATNSGGSASASSAATVAVLPATPTNTSQPVISDADNAMSHIQVGDNLSTTTGVWSNSPTGYSYQWQTSANGSTWTNAAVEGATTSSYTVASSDLSKYLRVVVTAANSGGSGAASSAATSAVLPATPTNTSQPVITDAQNALTHVQVGDNLSTTTGSWSNSPSGYSYQWQQSGDGSTWSNISGATTSAFTVTSSELSKYLRVVVQATNSGGSASASSAATSAVLPATPSNASQPVVTDAQNALTHVQVGDNLSTTTGDWSNSPTGYSYQWQQSADGSTWSNISGATASAFTVTSSELNKYLRAVVTAANSGGSGSASSAATSAVLPSSPTSQAQPTITGTAQVGQILSASNGTWTSSPTSYAYQWQQSANQSTWTNAGGAGATTSSYTVDYSDLNKYLRVVVTATNSGGSAASSSASTASVIAVAPVNSAPPVVSGSAQENSQLTTDNGSWTSQVTLTYSYQWQRCTNNSSTTSCAAISGATASSYTVQNADVGQYLRSKVTATDTYSQSASAYSAATSLAISSVPVGTVVSYVGATTPSGWLLADGSAVSRSTYSELYAVEGTTYGAGDGSTTFTLPNLQGKFPVGKSGANLGASGGQLDYSGSLAVASRTYNFSWNDSPSNPAFGARAYTWWGSSSYPNGFLTSSYPWVGTYSAVGPVTLSSTESGSVSASSRSASGTANITASYSSSNPPFAVVRYIVKAQSSAATPSCAVWASAATSQPAGTQRATGATATGAPAGCLDSSFAGKLPDLQGRFALGKTTSGTGATLGSVNSATLSQSASVVLNLPSTQITVTPSYTIGMTISSPVPSMSYSVQAVQYGGNGDSMQTAVFSSVGSATAGSDNGTVVQSANVSSSWPSGLSTAQPGAQTVSSSSFTAPYLALDYGAYSAANYSPATGTVTPFAGSTAPAGWLLADGSCASQTTYATLYSAVGNTYGSGCATGLFKLPDLTSKSAIGKAASGAASNLGDSGGSLSATPTASFSSWTPQLTVPSHTVSWTTPNHTYNLTGSPTIDGSTHGVCYGTAGCWPFDPSYNTTVSVRTGGQNTWASISGGSQTVSSTSGAQTLSSSATGALPVTLPTQTAPYQVFNYIIKY